MDDVVTSLQAALPSATSSFSTDTPSVDSAMYSSPDSSQNQYEQEQAQGDFIKRTSTSVVDQNYIVHVEVCQNPCSTTHISVIKGRVHELLQKQPCIYNDVKWTEFIDPFFTEHVKSIAVVDSDLIQRENQLIDLTKCRVLVHVYQLHEEGGMPEELDDEELAAANIWLLPSTDFEGTWESLVFESKIKSQLLQYASTMLLFSDHKVDANLVSWNRVILLHGPPGTGKTSLCKALAHKLCINLSDRFRHGQLVEINSHSLFSKWFSESGKLVMKMFQKIHELLEDQEALVCVLIDEVESLSAARKSSMAGSEPSDAIRVVNALLTQIDQIKRYNNVIILTTSNITGSIDLAFVDRADIKQYIGLPSAKAIYKIYQSSLSELVRTGIILPGEKIFDMKNLELMRFVENDVTRLSMQLNHISGISCGLSGRTLRKIPFLAHALYLQSVPIDMSEFLCAMEKAVQQQFEERAHLESS